MNVLLSFLRGAGGAVSLLVFALVFTIYLYCEFILLKRGRQALQIDRESLDKARAMLEKLATKTRSGVAPEAVIADLVALPPEGAVSKRVRTLATHRAQNALSPVDRVALIETESARQQAGTNWPRFWAGAFPFIGLIGTLLGLSIAVFHLISIVGRVSVDAADGSALSQITSGMTATFSGMGGAFLSTAVGVLFSVLLSTTISRHEHAVESFRLDFEEFSHLRLEPFVSRAQIALREGENGLVVGGVWDEIDELAPMRALVERIERASQTFDGIAHSFAGSMEKAARAFDQLHKASDGTAASLQNAGAAMLGSVRGLDAAVAPLASQIETLNGILIAQKVTQDEFLHSAGRSVARLEDSTQAATTAFEHLARLEARWDQGLERQNEILRANLGELGASVDAIPETLGSALKAEIAGLRGLLGPLPEYVALSSKTLSDAVQNSQNGQARFLTQLESLTKHLGDYASQMDEAVARHAAAAYAKPLAEFDAKSLDAARQLSSSVLALQSEISGLKASLGETGGQVKAMGGGVQTQAEQLRAVDERLARMSQMLGRMETAPDVSQSWLYGVDRLLGKWGK